MPWLAGTALLHSSTVVEKRDTLKGWTILLAIVAFSLSLLGTFLVRSGVLTSVHAFATSAGSGAYAASKGAVLAFTRAAAIDLAPDNIRVNAVLPGAVDTAMLSEGLNRSDDPKAARSNLEQRTIMGRVGRPEEIAQAILFLADEDRSSFITGQNLIVDGGALARLSTE